MLEYDIIDIYEGIDVKTSVSEEYDICHYWYFKDEPYLCNGCQDLMQKALSVNDIAIICV